MKTNNSSIADTIIYILIAVSVGVAFVVFAYYMVANFDPTPTVYKEAVTKETCRSWANAMEVDWRFDKEYGCLIRPLEYQTYWVELGRPWSQK